MIEEELQGIKKEDYVDTTANGNDNQEPEELTAEEEMMKILGFAGFDSSKGKQIETNVNGAAAGAARKVFEI